MRQGYPPEAACKKAVERIVQRNGAKAKELQVGFIAINKKGAFGGYCLQQGFDYAVCTADNKNILLKGKHWF
jgi:N4-(beta-N-acetylglucosaminyl)-L-asparaginase